MKSLSLSLHRIRKYKTAKLLYTVGFYRAIRIFLYCSLSDLYIGHGQRGSARCMSKYKLHTFDTV